MWWAVVLALCWPPIEAFVADYNTVPQGNNPTLYRPGFDPVVHLDQHTFDDTVFGQDRAYVVEFYADW